MKNLFKKIKYYLLKKKGIFYPRFADSFYTYQQEKLRGSVDEIKKRQLIYLKYIRKVSKELRNKNSFIDIGFGRGEFIELLRAEKFKNIEGVDINKKYVLNAKKKGYTVFQDDGLRHLYLSEKKFYGISAFHLIEHINFNQLFDLMLICSKKLVKGGVLILETPNIENIKVSSNTFNLDYTHKLRLPSLLIKTLLEYLDFKKIEFLYLQLEKNQIKDDVERLLYGAQDLGVVAYK